MGKIELDFRVLGDVGTNCYLLCNQETKECILIDAPDFAGQDCGNDCGIRL